MPHRLLTTVEQREAGLYLADATDEEDIAEPLSGVLARRGILPGSSDLADLLELVIAVGAYLVRQMQLRADLRRGLQLIDEPADPAA